MSKIESAFKLIKQIVKGKTKRPETGGPACPYKKGKSKRPETGGPACPYKKGKSKETGNRRTSMSV